MRRAITRGLSQLLSEPKGSTKKETAVPTKSGSKELAVQWVSLDQIRPNKRQPRTQFDDDSLVELEQSIRQVGVLQPIVLRQQGDSFEIIAGERRWRAAKAAGLQQIPSIVRTAGDQSALELALIENIQREDIGPVECALAYRSLIDEFGLTQEQVSKRIGKSRVAIANTVRLLRLPEEILDGLQAGSISEGHARALLSIEQAEDQLSIYEEILVKGLTVRDVERRAKQFQEGNQPLRGEKLPTTRDPHFVAIEEAVALRLGIPAKLTSKANGGTLSMDYYSDDDLDRILEALGVRL